LAFASGMTLIDTANGVFMAWAYGWTMTDPTSKLFYNLFLTATSAVVALAIGSIEALGGFAQEMDLQGPFWSWIANVNNHFEVLGYGVISIFVISLAFTNASSSFSLQCFAILSSKGSSGFGVDNNACTLSNIVRICNAGDHFSFNTSKHILPSLSMFG